jgi:hypothetical protein
MARHFELYNIVLSGMESSYVNRNPCDRDYWIGVKRKRMQVLEACSKKELPSPEGRTAAALIGDPGTGKSVWVKRDIGMYPDAIRHKSYNGKRIPCLQVPCVRVEVDRSTNVKGICDQIFYRLDRILGTTYVALYGGDGEQGKMAGVVSVCHIHGIALIVVDEIQEMSLKKSGGLTSILSFMLNLANIAGPFVLFVGTPKAKVLASDEFHHIRRQSSLPEWSRFRQDSEDWIDFVDALLSFSCIKSPLDHDSVKVVLYEITRGIPDFAIQLYKAAQRKLVMHPGPENKEVLTPDFLRAIARSHFYRELAAIAALDRRERATSDNSKSTNLKTLFMVHDSPTDLNPLPQLTKATSKRHAESEVGHESSSTPAPAQQADSGNANLRDIFQSANQMGTSVVSQLREAGITKHATEFIEGEK